MPQGSILGPLPFLIYINDIGDNLTSPTRLFADDCVLYREITNPSDRITLQQDLDLILRWSQLWQLPLNLSKCNALCITTKRNYLPTHHYTLNNTKLIWANTFTYLGIKIQHNLKWENQVKSAVSKATNLLNLLRRNMYGCSRDSKARAYTALVRPHLEYASPVWNPHEQKNIETLEKVQRRAARWITAKWDSVRKEWSKSYEQSKEELGWPSLRQRRTALQLCQLYKIVNHLDCIAFSKYFSWNPSSSTRSHKFSIFPIHARTNIYRYSFFVDSVYLWNSLPLDIVESPSLATFKYRLNQFL